MSNNIFKVAPLVEQSFFQKLFKQHNEENAVIELNNILANKDLLAIKHSDIFNIETKYNLSLENEFKLNLEEFYAVYLNHCLADKIINEEEIIHLKHLKKILSISDASIKKIHSKIGEKIYRSSFQEAVSDGRLTDTERKFLEKIEKDFLLSEELVEKISKEVRSSFVNNYIDTIIKDQRLSPEEDKELEAIATSLNVTLDIDNKNGEILNKLRLYWTLENQPLPIAEIDIALQKSESCHFVIQNVDWYELRSVRQRVSYSGYSTSFKVAKGFYLRTGSYTPRSYSTDEMTLIDSGNLYLTNKRIIFTGNKKNTIIQLSKILNVSPFEDGVEIGKETGKNPLIQIGEKADVFAVILERLVRER